MRIADPGITDAEHPVEWLHQELKQQIRRQQDCQSKILWSIGLLFRSVVYSWHGGRQLTRHNLGSDDRADHNVCSSKGFLVLRVGKWESEPGIVEIRPSLTEVSVAFTIPC